jgi:hypothetical protein
MSSQPNPNPEISDKWGCIMELLGTFSNEYPFCINTSEIAYWYLSIIDAEFPASWLRTGQCAADRSHDILSRACHV